MGQDIFQDHIGTAMILLQATKTRFRLLGLYTNYLTRHITVNQVTRRNRARTRMFELLRLELSAKLTALITPGNQPVKSQPVKTFNWLNIQYRN